MSEWITDRLPTAADADEDHRVYYTSPEGKVMLCCYEAIETGEAWALKPKNVVPKPYVKPEPRRWKPQDMERYFCIFPSTIIGQAWLSEKGDYDRWAMGNCFATYNEAAAAMEQVKNLLIMLQTKD
jgi:hypothetical protein